jgi:hypothetical protein
MDIDPPLDDSITYEPLDNVINPHVNRGFDLVIRVAAPKQWRLGTVKREVNKLLRRAVSDSRSINEMFILKEGEYDLRTFKK